MMEGSLEPGCNTANAAGGIKARKNSEKPVMNTAVNNLFNNIMDDEATHHHAFVDANMMN